MSKCGNISLISDFFRDSTLRYHAKKPSKSRTFKTSWSIQVGFLSSGVNSCPLIFNLEIIGIPNLINRDYQTLWYYQISSKYSSNLTPLLKGIRSVRLGVGWGSISLFSAKKKKNRTPAYMWYVKLYKMQCKCMQTLRWHNVERSIFATISWQIL